MKTLLKHLETKIQESYESGVTLVEAEKLAAEFLHAQIKISEELKVKDLDARMKKTSVKSLRAALYSNEVSRSEKKPTEATLSAMLDSNDIIQGEQERLDQAEAERDELQRYYNISREAHLYFRGISRGRFE